MRAGVAEGLTSARGARRGCGGGGGGDSDRRHVRAGSMWVRAGQFMPVHARRNCSQVSLAKLRAVRAYRARPRIATRVPNSKHKIEAECKHIANLSWKFFELKGKVMFCSRVLKKIMDTLMHPSPLVEDNRACAHKYRRRFEGGSYTFVGINFPFLKSVKHPFLKTNFEKK